jgi:LmbE family N-acetylglucosaminyl deacetylase
MKTVLPKIQFFSALNNLYKPSNTKISILILLFLAIFSAVFAQKPQKPTSADIFQSIRKLNVLGSVLYVAAHPDDENQRFISYMANEKLYNVTYLSLTRGDGGQNLIGAELREQLGVLRTQELLMARSVDGGKQRFSRANDFGFSKNPEETLQIWNKEEVLSDVVWQFRQTQPDVVVNRFYHDKGIETHGHHTASAMLSVEAFDLAAKKEAYPEQLTSVAPWQARRTFFNTSWWFYGSKEAFEKLDKKNLFQLDLGVFLPLKGKSNNELAAEARSMHRCQGFGSKGVRGESIDYFDFIKGEKPKSQDMFEGINTTWTRIEGGKAIGKILAKVEKNFNINQPSASVPMLLKALVLIEKLPNSYWKTAKLAEIKDVIRFCTGLFLEATATEVAASPGDKLKMKLEAIQRGITPVILTSVRYEPALFDTTFAFSLLDNKVLNYENTVKIPENTAYTAPYWLQKPYTNGMYTVTEQALRGLPETPRFAKVLWKININGTTIDYETPVVYKTEEPAIGEIYKPFEVLPPVFLEFNEQSYLFPNQEKTITVKVKAGKDKIAGQLTLEVPNGWTVSESQAFELNRKGEEKTLNFKITATKESSEGLIKAFATVGNNRSSTHLSMIQYDHIPPQSVLMPATARAARLEVSTKAHLIGYYMGAGDEVPAALRQIGCEVKLLEDKDINIENLQKYDAIVVGIRAYNTKDALKFEQPILLDYAKNGGTLVLQYNTSGDIVTDQLAPFKMKISRTRVTDEKAEVRFILPENPALNLPNKLTNKDFDGWIQERGLYFANEWDTAFAAPISLNDPTEKAADGALLIAPYGKGWYVYSSLSFFREMPMAVPGAVRLFANLISTGK